MPGFDSIIAQQLPIRLLQTFRAKSAIPHALMFTGIPGVGKRSVALRFAMALNCRADQTTAASLLDDGKPCGTCAVCRRIVAGNHPDILHIEPQKGLLRISQIRGLIATMAMKPFTEGYRVVIIADAHLMNQEAANALLKLLEEPPAGAVLILTTPRPTDLLPTIASRCRHIRFTPLPPDALADHLRQQHGIEAQSADSVAELAGGSLTEAVRLAVTPWQSRRDWLVREAGLDAPAPTLGATARAALAFGGILARDKEQVTNDLELLKSWIRDLWIQPHAGQALLHRDCAARLQQVRRRIGTERLAHIWESIETAQKDIAANANLRLTLDVMALAIAGFI